MVEHDQIPQALQTLFNDVLEGPWEKTLVELEKACWVLNTRPQETPAEEYILLFICFHLKVVVMQRAREQ